MRKYVISENLSAVTFPCSRLIPLYVEVSGKSFYEAINASEELNHSLGLILPKQDKVRECTTVASGEDLG